MKRISIRMGHKEGILFLLEKQKKLHSAEILKLGNTAGIWKEKMEKQHLIEILYEMTNTDQTIERFEEDSSNFFKLKN